jgi:microcystin-dependent protein
MAVYYINGTSNSGATFGQSGYFYPLYLTSTEANSASDNTAGTSHPHTFEEAPNITFYMPVEDAAHAQSTAPSGSYSGELYISYTSPIAEIDVEEIGTGVLASDTFNSWRKKTNDVARETIANKASIGSVDTRLTRLLSVTGGENNIMTLSSSDNITGEKEFEGLVKFTAADDLANAVQVGTDGKLYVSSSKFFFDKDVDLHEAGAELKASNLDLPTGKTKYAGVQYTWPSQAPIPGQILKSAPGNTLTWVNEAAAEATVEAFLIEDPNPIGSVLQWTTNTPPSKWLICNGDAVSRTTYSNLFAVIGETYGAGDGTTTFNLPDLRARVPVGRGTNTDVNNLSAAFETLGSSQYVVNNETLQGEFKHDITIDEMPIHGHAIPTRWDDGNNSGTSSGSNRNIYDNSSSNSGGISLPNSDNGNLQFRGNFVTGLAGGNSYTAATRSIREVTNGSGKSDLYDGSESGAAPFIGAGLPEEYTGQTKINQGNTTASGDGSVQESLMNVVQPFIVLNYIIKAEGSTIVEQNITPSNGILINDAAAQTNLLEAGSVNTIKMDVDSNDFEFNGNQLKLKDDLSITTATFPDTTPTASASSSLTTTTQGLAFPFTKYFETEFVSPNASTAILTPINHNLGGSPAFTYVTMICTSNDQGYVVGDEIPFNSPNNISNNHGPTLYFTSTQFKFTTHGHVYVTSPDNATSVIATSYNRWKWRIKAWR